MTTALSPADTRGRLLEAAGEVFSQVGYRQATVRGIVARAGANIAAVNYHFRDKEGLYAAVLEHSMRSAVEKYPPHGGLGAGAPPEERLSAFVRSFLQRLFDPGPQAHHGKLMAREMVEPTAALDRITREVIRPMYVHLCSLVRALAGPRPSDEQVRLCARSVVGQCLFYKHAEPVLLRLEGRKRRGPKEIERLADHITGFSLAGIRQVAGRAGRTPR